MNDNYAQKMCLCPCVCLHWCCGTKKPTKEPTIVPVMPKKEKHVMDNLFANKLFFLIYVDLNDKMSLVKPFRNKELQKDIQEKGYRCISHVWGTTDPDKDYIWKDHGVKGIKWEVETREEKRERLLQIFHHHKGYFWMDNLCIDQGTKVRKVKSEDKPLEIMGDIYGKCLECVCMLDTICDVPGFLSEKDLMVDIAKDVKKSLETGELIDNKYPDKYSRKDNFVGVGHQKYLTSMMTAKWFDRVWTWQEVALPPKILFCSENARKCRYDPIDHEFLKELFPYKFLEVVDAVKRVECIMEKFGKGSDAVLTITTISFTRSIAEARQNLDIWDKVKLLSRSMRKCTNEEDYVYGITGVLNAHISKGLALYDAKKVLDDELRKQGIFIEDKSYDMELNNMLCQQYGNRSFYDGIRVFGKVDDIAIFGEFNPDVDIIGHTCDKILSKNSEPTSYCGEKLCHEYTTETSTIYLETDEFNIGDMLELTEVGRKGCTFESQEGSSGKIIFKTIGDKVEVVGIMVREEDKHRPLM